MPQPPSPVPAAPRRNPDNLAAGSSRLTGVADRDPAQAELRRCLSERAAAVPTVPAFPTDLAGAVIARGRRARRRRTAGRLVAVVGATVLATGGLWQVWQPAADPQFGAVNGFSGDPFLDREQAEPPQLAADDQLAAQLPADVLGDGAGGGTVLATAGGDAIDLRRVTSVIAAERVDGGWAVISGEPGRMRLWWAIAGQAPRSLLTGMDAIVMQQRRVAWQRGGVLAVATLAGGQLADRVTTLGLDGGAQPAGLLGPTVLLRRPGPDGSQAWDTWDPARGDYRPRWTEQVLRVYGLLPDGAGALGLIPPPAGGERPCLARLDLRRGLAPAQTRCPVAALAAGGPAALSPQQRWLFTTADGEPALVALTGLFEAAAAPVIPIAGVTEPVTAAVWLGPERAVLTAGQQLLQVWPERLAGGAPAAVEQFPLTGTPPVVVGSG
jgi:hypothetical protein